MDSFPVLEVGEDKSHDQHLSQSERTGTENTLPETQNTTNYIIYMYMYTYLYILSSQKITPVWNTRILGEGELRPS